MQPNSLWPTVLGEIELSISRPNYMTWFKPTQLLKCDEESAVIGVPNIFFIQQLERKYNKLIIDILAKNGAKTSRIEYKVHTSSAKKPTPDSSSAISPVAPSAPQPAAPSINPTHNTASAAPTFRPSPSGPAAVMPGGRATGQSYQQKLNERYTFETFIEGSGNELAYAACQAIAASPGTKYNPLFLYGGVGIGKTHLMQAVGNAVLLHNPSARVVYVSSEQFLQGFVEALRFKKIKEFNEFYRTADVLIVDDVQFIAGKEKAQEEFFHTFNTLHQANKQIIISSDKPPRDIPTLEDRLRSRFVWGMTIDMQIPDFETRCAILQTKSSIHGIELPQDVTEYLAGSIQTNIRELEGALNQLIAVCEMRGVAPSLAIVTGIRSATKARPKHLSAKQIIERTAKHFQISVDEILSSKRDKDIVMPRQVAMYILRNDLHLSFPKIARELGRKDHTTAIHSVEKIEKEIHTDTDMRDAVSSIREQLNA